MDLARVSVLERAAAAVLAVVAFVAVAIWLFGGSGSSDGSPAPEAATPAARASAAYVARSKLPREARVVIAKIRAGGTFSDSRDGRVFGNRRGLLPNQPSGYYHEYAVSTPGASDRGARTIVAGAGGTLYYSADHERSFRQIRR